MGADEENCSLFRSPHKIPVSYEHVGPGPGEGEGYEWKGTESKWKKYLSRASEWKFLG